MYISEKLGVPSSLRIAGEKVYKDILFSLEKISKLKNKGQYLEIGKTMDVRFGGIERKTLPIVLETILSDKLRFYNIAYVVYRTTKGEKKPSMMYHVSVEGIKLTIHITKNSKLEDIKKEILNEISIPLVMHELKHMYDIHMGGNVGVVSHSKYSGFISGFDYDYPIISNLSFYLYYTHEYENLVRPSEILGQMIDKNIKRNEFINFLEESKIYQTLKVASTYNLEELLIDIKKDEDLVEKVKDIQTEDDNLDELLIDIFGGIIRKNIITDYKSLMTKHYDKYKKNKIFNLFHTKKQSKYNSDLLKNINKLSKKFSDDNITFIKAIFDEMNRNSIKAMRKIDKMIDFLPEETNPIHQKINRKIMEYNKFFEEYKNESSLLIVDIQKSFKEFFTELYLHKVKEYCEEFTKVYQVWDNHVDGRNVDKDYLYDDDPYVKHHEDLYKFPNQIELIEKRYNYDVDIDFFKKDLNNSVYKTIKEKENNKTLKQGDYYPTKHGTFLVYIGNNHIWFQVPKKLYEIFKEHRGKELIIVGGADSECIEDVFISGEAFGVKMKRDHRYIYSATHCPF